jgi:molybdopterin synthase sulfur carrier subunit
MKRSILFFGQVRDVAGAAAIEAELPADVGDVPALIDWLTAGNEHLGAALRAPGVRVAIDWTITPGTAMLHGAREIAFMSPLSGG